MNHYTHLNEKELQAILVQFGLHSMTSFKLLSGGSENTNYLVQSEKEKYVLCIFEQKTAKNAKELAQLLKHLEVNHFDTSKLIDSVNGESVIIWKEKPVMLKVFIEGEIKKDLSPYWLQLIGIELAKLHHINAPDYLPKQLNFGIEQFNIIKEYAANSEFEAWLRNIQAYISPYLKLDLPKSLIHSDVFWNNVIIDTENNRLTIIDFEEGMTYYRVFDIGMSIIGICGEEANINLEKVKHLLEGYQLEIQLSDDEKNALKAFTIYAGATMTFWRHQNFNYVKPDPKMFHHYKGLKVLVDDLMQQKEDSFLKLLENKE